MIHAPHALPLFREPRPGGKRKREKERQDPVKSQMPDRGGAAPLKPGTGGQIGATGGTLLTQYVLKNQARAGALFLGARACCKCSVSRRKRCAPGNVQSLQAVLAVALWPRLEGKRAAWRLDVS